MSKPGIKVGVSEEEKKLSYYKYYEQDLAPVPAEKIAVLQGGPITPEKCIPFEERNKFLKGEADEKSVTALLPTEPVLYVIPLTCRALQVKCLTGGSHGIL